MRLLYSLFFCFCCLFVAPKVVAAEAWSLPSTINDTNTTVTFDVDSTWHAVHGTTSQVTGTIRQRDPADPLSIEVDLTIPVGSFNTNWESRDERLAQVIGADQFKQVRFTSSKLLATCHPLRVQNERHCSGTLAGTLTIRDVTRPIALPVEVVRSQGKDTITGKLAVRWGDYDVEDPSILIARLDPTVTITYSTEVPLR